MTARQRTRPETLTTIKPNPVAWRHALRLAGGDARRLRANEDGSVLVTNRGRRSDFGAVEKIS